MSAGRELFDFQAGNLFLEKFRKIVLEVFKVAFGSTSGFVGADTEPAVYVKRQPIRFMRAAKFFQLVASGAPKPFIIEFANASFEECVALFHGYSSCSANQAAEFRA